MEQGEVGITFFGAALIVAIVVGAIWLACHIDSGTGKNKLG